MNNQAKLGVIAGILLIFFILIGAVSASVLFNTSDELSEDDLNKITNEVIDEICSYFQIKHIVGQYQTIHNEQVIKKIGILIKPYVSQEIDISHISVELCDGEYYYLLFYNGSIGSIHSGSFFEHSLWDSITSEEFGVLSTIDDDDSIIRSHMINKNSDMAFLMIHFSNHTALRYGDQIDITIQPSPGISRTVSLETPLPIKNVVTLYP